MSWGGCDRRPVLSTVRRRRARPPATAWAALTVTRSSLGVPQDCWFDAASLGPHSTRPAPRASPPLAAGARGSPRLLGRRGVYRLLSCVSQSISRQTQEVSSLSDRVRNVRMIEDRTRQVLPTATGFAARQAIAALRKRDMHVAPLLRLVGLSEGDLDNRQRRISANAQAKLLEFAAESLGDSAFGLHLA